MSRSVSQRLQNGWLRVSVGAPQTPQTATSQFERASATYPSGALCGMGQCPELGWISGTMGTAVPLIGRGGPGMTRADA
eukprot:10031169-Lingulodinium_polyedra.AAC.1